MNRNGVWDERETPEQAWRRLGLLGANETLTRERYASCVQNAARALVSEGFLSEANAAWYTDSVKEDGVDDTMSELDIKQAMRVISEVNGTPLSDERIERDLATYQSFLTAIDNIKKVELPIEAAPLPIIALKRS